jgi:allophanate hydrolase
MDMIRTCALTITDLRRKYMNRECTPEQVMRDVVRKAEDDRHMNIWITPPSMARMEPYLEQLKQWRPEDKPLWGIPFAIKDNIDVAGVPTTAGCPAFAYVPTTHATVVRLLIEAGAIPIGKTNMDQFATGLVGTRSPYGETHHAVDEAWISGGSSSGSAVAVARGQCAFALGTDTAGSGRVPAALHGLIGFKSSLGAWSKSGVVPACESLDCISVFTNTLEDVVAVDRAVRVADEADPWSRELAPLSTRTPSKILVPKEPLAFFGKLADAYEAAWARAMTRLEQLGLPVVKVDATVFAEAASILYEGPWIAERWASLGAFIESHPGCLYPVTEQVLRSGHSSSYDAASAFRSMHALQRYKKQVQALLRDAVIAFPTAGGTWTREEVAGDPIRTNRDMGMYTNHCNLLDLCALALPSDEAAEGMPFGITLFALADQESLLMGAGALYLQKKAGQSTGASLLESLVPVEGSVLVAVCGLHMRGLPLEKQMKEHGAVFIQETTTAARYRMVKLPTTPAKPGLIKLQTGGSVIQVEVWRMPQKHFGVFAALIPSPLGIGKVELSNGLQVPGFICEGYAEATAEDISSYGGWRAAMQ